MLQPLISKHKTASAHYSVGTKEAAVEEALWGQQSVCLQLLAVPDQEC